MLADPIKNQSKRLINQPLSDENTGSTSLLNAKVNTTKAIMLTADIAKTRL